eukprot:gnl/TRDRNA2_/TRDRNA2_167628_c0_seq7.p1 gnl/TRDRNA2_/TRDRNA2_167628_c0~~gnl/TRDRNA2_/TRDRNA2_167628_c0_seq7.p1  ORF type:complete len:303 (-),score=30.21 gnl/TRDRNA2_/TRDRNA2_167628_c0_seq7:13-921(-)
MQPAWGLYYMHCVSFPLWLGSAIREMRAQRHRLPSEWDFFGVRFMAAYVLLDGLRGFDLCFEGADGECQAVWGVCPLYLRMAAWFARDVCWPPGTWILWGSTLLAILALAFCMGSLLATNRQSWPAMSAIGLVLLNFPWTFLNLQLLFRVLPQIEMRSAGVISAQVVKARMGSKLILVANVVILVVFPAKIIYSLWWRDGHHRRFIPAVDVGSWVGQSVCPSLVSQPEGVAVDLSLEMVELAIGWLQSAYCLAVGVLGENLAVLLDPTGRTGACEAVEAAPPAYMSSIALGKALRSAVVKVD